MKHFDLPLIQAPASLLSSLLRRGLLPLLALLLCGTAAQASDPFLITGTVHRDADGATNATIDGPLIHEVSGSQLYVYLIDQNDSIVDAAPVLDNGTFQLTGITYRSYNISLSAVANPINSKHPLIVLPTAWVPTAEGQITSTSVIGDGYPDLGIAVNASGNITIAYGVNARPIGNPYTISNDVRDANGLNYVTHLAFTGYDPEDGTYATGMVGRPMDLFRANGGILFYNGVAVTAATSALGTRYGVFDTSKLRYQPLPWLPHNFAYSLVDAAGTPQYVPSIITMDVALPVDLLSFTGYTANGINILEWTTANERVNSGFVLERSTDGANFEAVGEVPSQSAYGSSSMKHNYSFRDISAPKDATVAYYRLRQTDLNGAVAYSPIVKLNAANPGKPSGNNAPLNLYPNPSAGVLNLEWNPGSTSYQIAVRNSAGSVVFYKDMSASDGALHSSIDLSSLPAGNYFVTLRGGDLQQSRQITLMK